MLPSTKWITLSLLLCYRAIATDSGIDAVSDDSCFCKLEGEVDDCLCSVASIDSLNNNKIFPRLQSLLTKNYFRYFKVNLKKPCPFWSDDSRCALKDCHVVCEKDNVPIFEHQAHENKDHAENKYSKESQNGLEHTCAEERELGALDTSLSDESKGKFQEWTDFDESLNMFCEIEDEHSADLEYVDLLKNPERYTGYKGESTWRIWRSIYEENCFKPSESFSYGHSEKDTLASMCLEKRTFFRMVSGLHTSINIHLCHQYLLPASNFGPAKWGPNIKEFKKRFDGETTNGQGPLRLKNLYFTYLVELRALAKVAPYLIKEEFYTGSPVEDLEVKEAVNDLLKVVRDFPDHFDESKLFQGDSEETQKLKIEFRDHFRNISRIMDCVGCDKCKLWGKVQVLGMGTALKILFSGSDMGPDSTIKAGTKTGFQLTRTEIVALFNAFSRLSQSIYAVENFRTLARAYDEL